MLPPDQGLRTAQDRLLSPYVKLRLVINQELLLFDRSMEAFKKLLFEELRFLQLPVIIDDRTGKAALRCIRSQLGTVEAPLNLDGFVDIGVNAEAEPQPHIPAVAEIKVRVFKKLFVIVHVRAVQEKCIRFLAARNTAPLLHEFFELPADIAQHRVCAFSSVALIDDMEMVDVHDDGIHFLIPVIQVILVGISIEEFFVVKTGKVVTLRAADDVPVFAELNGPAHTGMDYFRQRIRLRNKVDRSQIQAVDLGFPVGSQYDHGNSRIVDIVLNPAEYIKAVHIRQEKIKQYDAQSVKMSANSIHRFCAIGCKNQCICILQDFIENIAIDLFVLDDQDKALRIRRMKQHLIISHFKGLPFSINPCQELSQNELYRLRRMYRFICDRSLLLTGSPPRRTD